LGWEKLSEVEDDLAPVVAGHQKVAKPLLLLVSQYIGEEVRDMECRVC